MLTAEKNNVQALFLVAGGGGGGAAGQNTGQGYVNLVDWDDRPGPDNTADAIAQRARGALSGLRDAQIFALVPGAVRGMGDTSGDRQSDEEGKAGSVRLDTGGARQIK